jgi:nucleotidyltransferase substrate binding protein (TIGR01987 family)
VIEVYTNYVLFFCTLLLMLQPHDREIQMTYLRNAFDRLLEAIEEFDGSSIQRDGIIQRFEFSVELFWKTCKKLLAIYADDLDITGAKDAIRHAHNAGMIDNQAFWIDAIDERNILSHAYDEDQAESSLAFITESIDDFSHGYSRLRTFIDNHGRQDAKEEKAISPE